MSISVFLSTVSDEFRAYRDQLKGDLTRHNVAVKVQEDFKDLGKETLAKLDTYIANCDAVVHLVGDMTGAAPSDMERQAFMREHPDLAQRLPTLGEALRDDAPISYTQWEAWLALYHRKLLLIARARKTARRGPNFMRTGVSSAAQAAHLERLKACGRFPGCDFGSPDGLAKHLAYTVILDLLVKDYAAHEARAREIAEGFIKELARRVTGDKELDFDGMKQAVRNAIEIYEKEIAGAPPQTNFGDAVSRALAKAREQVDQGRSGLARATLGRAADEMERKEHERREEYVAAVTALRHRERDVALASYEGDAAAAAIVSLGRAIHGENPARATEFLNSEARALYEHGSDRGSNVHLAASIALRREMLALAASKEERGAARANLSLELLKLGERESGRTRLEEALAVLRHLLKEFTPQTAPFDWAGAQTNLGVALKSLGVRETGTARLEEGVAAYRAALEALSHGSDPLQWAATQNNLGNALGMLGERVRGTAQLQEAAAAYRGALQIYTREQFPLDWARTQNNLGGALLRLGERQPFDGWLEQAAQAYRAALEILSRETETLDWANAQSNLAFALLRLAERDMGLERLVQSEPDSRAPRPPGERGPASSRAATSALLEQAVAAFQTSLEERKQTLVPLEWASTQNNLGSALARLGEREGGTARLEQAVAAYRAALTERTREQVPLDWAASYGNEGVAMMLIAERTNDAALAEAAAGQVQTAYETLRDAGQEQWAVFYQTQLPRAQAVRDRLRGK